MHRPEGRAVPGPVPSRSSALPSSSTTTSDGRGLAPRARSCCRRPRRYTRSCDVGRPRNVARRRRPAARIVAAARPSVARQTRGLSDLEGRAGRSARRRRHRPSVLLFTAVDCPISDRYAPEVRRLAARFQAEGVAVWLVYANAGEQPAAARAHAAAFGYGLPVALDPAATLADRAGGQVTPEAAVFDAAGRLAYRGRIDDRYVDFGVDRPAPTHARSGRCGDGRAGRPARGRARWRRPSAAPSCVSGHDRGPLPPGRCVTTRRRRSPWPATAAAQPPAPPSAPPPPSPSTSTSRRCCTRTARSATVPAAPALQPPDLRRRKPARGADSPR